MNMTCGAEANDKAVSDEKQFFGLSDINDEGVIKLSAGRKRHALISAGVGERRCSTK
jgi:tyrosyl-tRNA synthetase